MSLRKLTSLTALFSFLLVLLSSVILYLTPQGRIAYWADWHLLGLTKDQWGAIHINTGALFLLCMFLHIYYNWNPILHYLQSRKAAFSSRESLASILVVIICFAGTLLTIPPFSSIMDLNEAIKEKAARQYGEPPYGHAELSSLTTFAKKRNQEPEELMTALTEAGYKVASPDLNLKEIAAENGVSPQTIYLAFPPLPKPATSGGASITLPPDPPPGTGNMRLSELGAQYGIPLDALTGMLAAANIQAAPEKTIKEIAAASSMSPRDVYAKIQEAVAAAPQKGSGQ